MKENWIATEQIIAAAEHIRAAGEYPSINRVREYLGGKGSNSTISKTLNLWKENNPDFNRAEYIAPPIPENISLMLRERLSEVWCASYTESKKFHDVRATGYLETIDILERKLLAAHQLKEDLSAENKLCHEEIGALKLQLQQQQQGGQIPATSQHQKFVKKTDKLESDEKDLFSIDPDAQAVPSNAAEPIETDTAAADKV